MKLSPFDSSVERTARRSTFDHRHTTFEENERGTTCILNVVHMACETYLEHNDLYICPPEVTPLPIDFLLCCRHLCHNKSGLSSDETIANVQMNTSLYTTCAPQLAVNTTHDSPRLA